MANKQEKAEALGFNTVQEMAEHQKWIAGRAKINAQIRTRAQQARARGSKVFDFRNIDLKGDN